MWAAMVPAEAALASPNKIRGVTWGEGDDTGLTGGSAPDRLTSPENGFEIVASDEGTVLSLTSPRDTTFTVGDGVGNDTLIFDLQSRLRFKRNRIIAHY